VLKGVRRDLGGGEQHVERLGLAHVLGGQLAREPLPELLDVAAEWNRPKCREPNRPRREPPQQLFAVRVAIARDPRLAVATSGWVRRHAIDDRIRGPVRVVRADHPGRQVAEGAIEDRLVAGPEIPLVGVGAELDVRDRPQRRGLLQLLGVDLVVGGQGPGRARVSRADVDERHLSGGGSERVAHHGQPRLGVRDDGSFARLDALPQKRHRAGEVIVLRFVDESVVTESPVFRPHRLAM
jgi:hypothetical protein